MKPIRQLFSAMAERKGQFKTISKTLSISVMNQTLSSGANFALGIYLVRVLTTADFGLYGIGFAITLLYAGVGDALFLTQMVVHVPDKAQQDKLPYAARMLVALIMFCVITVIVAGLIITLGGAWSQVIDQHVGLAFSIVAASITYILKDFFVRHAYTARRESLALWVNVTVAVTLVASLLVQYRFVGGLNSESALWIYALSNMAGALVGFAFVRLPTSAVSLHEIVKDVLEAWVGGRWALGGVAVTWSQTQAYMYVTAVFIGPVGVGLANTARILITPALFLMPAITQLVMPRLAELRARNPARMIKISMLFSSALVIFSVFYSVMLIGVGELLAHILIGKTRYDEISPLVAAWCLVMIFQFSRVGAVICLQVVKEFRSLTLVNAVSLLVAILIAVFLMQSIGVQGAILGTAIGELIFSVLLYRVVQAIYVKTGY